MANARLRIEQGDGQGRELELTRPLVIGRSSSCDLVLNDESCSRTHARIAPDGARARVEDLGSTNGTLVNGERVTVAVVEDGDRVMIGGTVLRYVRGPADGGATVILSGAAREDASVRAELSTERTLAALKSPQAVLDAVTGLVEATRGLPDRQAVARALLNALIGLLGAERCAVLLFRPGSLDPQDAQLVSIPEMRLDPRRPWVQQALTSRQALIIEDAKTAKRPLYGLVIPVHHGVAPQLLVYADRRKSPFSEEDMAAALRLVRIASALNQSALVHQQLRDELIEHRSRIHRSRRIVGESRSHQEVINAVRRIALGNQPVLFVGETGTGKELLARLLHDLSARSAGRFVAVNCSATPEERLEAEVLGTDQAEGAAVLAEQRGALEQAHGGSIFLDEVDAMDLASQARLASALRERRLVREAGGREVPIDVRLIAASDRDLSSLAQSGAFHEDLLALLALATIPVPPLRERREDIPLLADHFLKTHARNMNRQARRLAADVLKTLASYHWPGNVRELSNVMERAVMLSQGEEIAAELLPFAPSAALDPATLALDHVEKAAIARALEYCKYRKGLAAKTLGISWPTLNKKISDYGIVLPER